MCKLVSQVHDIIVKTNPYEDIGMDTELIKSGIMSSLEVFAIISQLEESFDIFIDEEYVTLENFSTVEAIANVVKKCKGDFNAI